ncbi:competence protein CoiA [Paractinoplanes globisporus]|uniref:Competence protein CoiA n=1 Tax=Paractinoplanes globisporus TaxID=113565 RepID=A0ABW6WEU9_9ACTN|nr:competence protein CoiA family protein [Actinoplanes globisporus]
MPLTANGLGGLLDATRDDLGGGVCWQSIHRVRPRIPLRCPGCGHAMHAKVSPLGLRFFAHDAAQRDCALNGETVDHRLLKSAIAAAVRRAGWRAELEATGPDRRWRADVLAIAPDDNRTVAWEAQLSAQSADQTQARTARYTEDGIDTVWVFGRRRIGEQRGVSVTVDGDDRSIRVTGPVARLNAWHCEPGGCVRYRDLPSGPACPRHAAWEAVHLALDDFVSLVCRGAEHRLLPVLGRPATPKAGAPRMIEFAERRWWTSSSDLRTAHAIRDAQQTADAVAADLRERLHRESDNAMARRWSSTDRRSPQRRRPAADLLPRRALRPAPGLDFRMSQQQRHVANLAALRERQRRLKPTVLRQVTEQTGIKPWCVEEGDPDYAMGVSIFCGEPVAVICPVASRITPEVAQSLADVTVYVASERELRAIARHCLPGQQMVIVSDR